MTIRDLTQNERDWFIKQYPNHEVPDCAIRSEYAWWYGVKDPDARGNKWERWTSEERQMQPNLEDGARYVKSGGGPFIHIEVKPESVWKSRRTEPGPWYPAEG